ncbi:conserved hypothetical protein [Gammaproteobacteria bacterium]
MKDREAMVVLEETAASLRESAESIHLRSSFEEGRLLGYYEALSTIISQCDILGITKNDIGLTDFTPESLLKSRAA